MLTFNRLKQLSEDKKVIGEAIKPSELVDLSEDSEKIRRNPDVPIPENSLEWWNEVKTRTVYVKGFAAPDTTLDEILEYLKPHGKIVNVVMRKTKEPKQFKGSIFATFSTVEEANNLVNSEEAKTHKGNEMIVKMQKDYWAESVAKTKAKRAEMKALKEQKKIEALQEEHAAQIGTTFIKGQVLLVKNFPETTDYTAAKEFFSKYAPAGYIEIDNDKHEARIRFQTEEEDVAKNVLKKIQENSEKPVYLEKELELSVLEGDEESKYWADFNKAKALKFANRSNNRGKKRGGQRNHGGNKRPKIEDEEAENGDQGNDGGNKKPKIEIEAENESKDVKVEQE